MYYTYIIKKNSRHYIGSCENISIRLDVHNSGRTKSTKYGIPWVIIHKEEFKTRQDAYRRERQIKSYKGGNAFKELLKQKL